MSVDTVLLRPQRVVPVTLASLARALSLGAPAGAEQVELTGAAIDSRDCRPGDLFGAFPGLAAHGASFAAQAVAAGAVAVLTDADGARLIVDAGVDVPVLVSGRPRGDLGEAAAHIYGHPSRDLALVGVTGTNGKTTTSYFIDQALACGHPRRAILGTVEMRIGDWSVASPRTTMEAPVLHGLLARMREEGVTAAVAEVSSHAIALDRIAGVRFAVAVFTNLQWEHLDFHGTMEDYFAAKAALFTPRFTERAVVLVDDEWGARLAQTATVPVQTLSTRADAVAQGHWQVADARLAADGVGSDFMLLAPDGSSHAAHAPLPAAINVSNAAAAIVAGHVAGIGLAEAIAAVAAAPGVPGRMQRVLERDGRTPLAIVDYAHTPDALERVLEGVRAVTPGRVISVFGAGGDRDTGKRPKKGVVAARLADVIVITDDNPRTEPAQRIRAEILAGVDQVRPGREGVLEVSPRAEAIRAALRLAGPEDTVVLSGKGHEDYQEIDGVRHPFSDPEQLRQAAAEIFSGQVDP